MTIEELRSRLLIAEATADENRELYLRAFAECQNIKKRSERDIESVRNAVVAKFAADILVVRDCLEETLVVNEDEGLRAILALLNKAIKENAPGV